jgi:drug/metabolite transporter (DMT)-like permease
LYSFCSSFMLLINKLLIKRLPFSSLVMLVQVVFSIITAALLRHLKLFPEIESLSLKQLKMYLVYVLAFVFGLYANIEALKRVNVETIIVFRSCLPLVVSILEYFLLNRQWPERGSFVALLVLALGTFGYVKNDKQLTFEGPVVYTWVVIWFFMLCFVMTYGKQITDSVKLSTWGSVYYNNLLSIPAFLALSVLTNDVQEFYKGFNEVSLSYETKFLLILSGVIGVGISYSGWWCREILSATAYTLVGVTNKIITIFLNILLGNEHASPTGIFWLVVCLSASIFYKQAPIKVKI